LKILFFVQYLAAGGVVRQLGTQVDELEQRGHSVSVVGLYESADRWRPLWETAAGPTKSLVGAPAKRLVPAAFQALRATGTLRRRLRQDRVDVLYAFEGNLARFMAWLATRRSSTTVVWGLRGAGRNYSFRSAWKLALQLRLCTGVSASVPLLISNSSAALARREAGGWRCRRQLTIPNGFDTELFRPDPEGRARVRAEWRIGDEPLVGLISRMAPDAKGHPAFLDAARLLLRHRPDLQFVIVGGGAPESSGELERLSWVEFREDMPAVYNAIDILCSASHREGFPNVIGEAMACGVPCVVTDVGASAEIVGDTGIVVPPDEPALLADALDEMVRRLPSIQPLAIRESIANRFSVERCIDATEAALLEARSAEMERKDLAG
jgi:glycosyltransferase involved in cell wall biosynthesis